MNGWLCFLTQVIAVSSLLICGGREAYISLHDLPKSPIIYFHLPLHGGPCKLNQIPSPDNISDQHIWNLNIQPDFPS